MYVQSRRNENKAVLILMTSMRILLSICSRGTKSDTDA